MKMLATMTFATPTLAALALAQTRHVTMVKAAGAAGRGRRIRSNVPLVP